MFYIKMNTLLIGIGQAGTTISSLISENLLNNSNNNSFINLNGISCKAFLIDSESKVINNILNNKKKISNYFSKYTNIITNSSGRGNNWALGYSLQYKEFKTENNINKVSYEYLRKFLEKCDFIDKIIFIHSLNGGTGSGVGSRMIEMIKEEYNKMRIISCPIFGFGIENTSLSQFNTFFTLATIYDKVDNIIRLDNEKICKDKNILKSDLIEASLVEDYIIKSDNHDFNFEKYFFNNKFVDVGYLNDDYIINNANFNPDKMLNKIFHGRKNGILTCDSIYKTNMNNNKEYIKFNSNLMKVINCEFNSVLYETKKDLKNNKMNINIFYKSNNIDWLENLSKIIGEKLQQKYILFHKIMRHIF